MMVHTAADIMWVVGPTITGTITLSISARDRTCGLLGVFPYPYEWWRSSSGEGGPLSGVLVPFGTARFGALNVSRACAFDGRGTRALVYVGRALISPICRGLT